MAMSQPSLFISHNHTDKPFVRRLGADLAALGVRVWIDEAELNVGDSLLQTIARAIDEMRYLAVVLSPASVQSSWVQQELEQAMSSQLAARQIKVLPILYQPCEIPGFLRGKVYADFTRAHQYDESVALLARSMGVDLSKAAGATLYDPFSERFGRLRKLYSRPVTWHCIFCGWQCTESFNDYICKACGQLRPFAGGSATMIQCKTCLQMSLAVARFCEWCGTPFAAPPAQAPDM